jgi:carbon monoxide dehydrogenase subunit G
MIRIERTVSVDRPVGEVAKYLSDFRTTEQWDPHTVRCSREDTGPVAVGSRFTNVQRIGPVRSSFEYHVVDLDPGRSIRLASSSSSVDLTDTMTFTGDENRAEVTYVAELELKGPARFAEPVMRRLMNRIGDEGARGMAEALYRLPTA